VDVDLVRITGKERKRMAKSKYGKLISREIIEESKYPQLTSPMVKYRGDRGGRDLTFEWYCVDKPLVMDDEPEVNDFDQFMFFTSGNINDITEFEAEIELPLGKEGKKYIINETKFVHIPKGLVHGPLNFKNVRKPIVYYSVYLAPKYATELDASRDLAKYLAKPEYFKGTETTRMFHGEDMPFRHQYTTIEGYMAWSSKCGFDGNLCWGYSPVRKPGIGWEPVHYHKRLDERRDVDYI
jgi:hypothetical protein